MFSNLVSVTFLVIGVFVFIMGDFVFYFLINVVIQQCRKRRALYGREQQDHGILRARQWVGRTSRCWTASVSSLLKFSEYSKLSNAAILD